MNNWRTAEKVGRRVIIIVFAFLLVPHAIGLISTQVDNGEKETLAELRKEGPLYSRSIDKSLKIDLDTFNTDTLYITPKQVVLKYSIRRGDRGGWSFPTSAIKLLDANGNELFQSSSGSNGTSWGEIGFIHYDAENGPHTSLTLKYDLYDRQATVALLPPDKGGEGQ